MGLAMVVDDSKPMRMILSSTLAELGYEVHAEGSALEALQYLEDEKPGLELMLVDWNMPGVDGLEFVRRVRTMPGYRTSPLMMVTTETEMDHVIQALDAGANEYVMKPFTTEIIADKLRLMGLLQ